MLEAPPDHDELDMDSATEQLENLTVAIALILERLDKLEKLVEANGKDCNTTTSS